jgi:hypothetical protein
MTLAIEHNESYMYLLAFEVELWVGGGALVDGRRSSVIFFKWIIF